MYEQYNLKTQSKKIYDEDLDEKKLKFTHVAPQHKLASKKLFDIDNE